MEPMHRMMVIRLLNKMSLDQEMAKRLQIADASGYRKGGKQDEDTIKKQ